MRCDQKDIDFIRGDTFDFDFVIIDENEKVQVDGSIYTEIELVFNPHNKYCYLRKLKSKNEVSWISGDGGYFHCSLSQDDTFTLKEGDNEVQVSLYVNGTRKATYVDHIEVGKSLSEEVIG